MIENLLYKMIDIVEALGYLGIFIMTLVEGTFVPIPSEVTMIPAGYLVATGEFKLWLVLLCGILGTLSGALLNYFIAYYYGRQIVMKYGKYFLFTPEKLQYIEKFFQVHGPISTFIGRIVPGLKHFISFPAGLAKMNIRLFCLYTGIGGGLWVSILVFLGYFIGKNQDEINIYMSKINYAVVIGALLIIALYILRLKYKNKK